MSLCWTLLNRFIDTRDIGDDYCSLILVFVIQLVILYTESTFFVINERNRALIQHHAIAQVLANLKDWKRLEEKRMFFLSEYYYVKNNKL